MTGTIWAALIVAAVGLAALIIAEQSTRTVNGEERTQVDPKSGLVSKVAYFDEDSLPVNLYLPFFSLHLGSIFASDILAFDINFFEKKEPLEGTDSNGDTIYYLEANGIPGYQAQTDDVSGDKITSKDSSSAKLREIVASWYYRLRTMAIVASMLILIYIGIRITFSSINPNGKAKYKNMLMDWLVSICLIFCMHYIMLFSIKVVEYVTAFVNADANEGGAFFLTTDLTKKMKESMDKAGLTDTYIREIDGEDRLFFSTNMFGYIRLMTEFAVGYKYVGYAVIYIVCVLYILFFTFTYLKRVLYMAFLTIISPLVAMTYPIDKINDGSAQAFNAWVKEYIFNLLIQPMHMLLYYILITSAFSLAADNVIYAMVAIGFMVPAEKIVRKFFGFDKAQTPGLLAGAGGAALAMSGLKSLSKFAKGGPPKKDGDKGPGDGKIKQTSTFKDLIGENGGDSEESNLPAPNPTGPTQPDPTQPGPTQPDPTQPGPTQPDPTQPGSNQPDPTQPGSNQPDPNPTGGNQSGNSGRGTPLSSYGNTQYSDTTGNPRYIKNRDRRKKKPSRLGALRRVMWNRVKPTKKKFKALAGTAGKLALKAAGAGTLMTAGGLIGLATGDAGKVAQYAATGGVIGNSFGEAAYNNISGGINQFTQDFRNEMGEEYASELAEKRYIHDADARRVISQELGVKSRKDINKAMKDAVEYQKYGIRDNKIIAQAMKADDLGADPTDRRRILAAKVAEQSKGSIKTFNDNLAALKKAGIPESDINLIGNAARQIDGNI